MLQYWLNILALLLLLMRFMNISTMLANTRETAKIGDDRVAVEVESLVIIMGVGIKKHRKVPPFPRSSQRYTCP